jgi:hypothetical protein
MSVPPKSCMVHYAPTPSLIVLGMTRHMAGKSGTDATLLHHQALLYQEGCASPQITLSWSLKPVCYCQANWWPPLLTNCPWDDGTLSPRLCPISQGKSQQTKQSACYQIRASWKALQQSPATCCTCPRHSGPPASSCQDHGWPADDTPYWSWSTLPYRPCEVPQFFSVPSCAELCERQKWRPFSWTLEVLTNAVLQIWKKCQNADDLRILALFQIFKIPLLCTSKGHAKCFEFSVFLSIAMQISVGNLAGKVAALCMACKGT